MNIEKLKPYFLIIKSYAFLSGINIFNAFYQIIIYPVVVPKIGLVNYGDFLFAVSISSFFSILILHGYELPAVKNIKEKKSSEGVVVSLAFLGRLAIFSFFFFIFSFFFFENYVSNIFYVVWISNCLASLFSFLWIYQVRERLGFALFVFIAVKIVFLYIIYSYVLGSEDLLLFAVLSGLSNLLPNFLLFILIFSVFKIKLQKCSLFDIFFEMKLVSSFAIANILNGFKQRSIEASIAIFVGGRELAIYDLANKIFQCIMMLATSINSAIYPFFIGVKNKISIKNIFIFEIFVGFFLYLSLIIFGYFAIEYLGGEEMKDSYDVLVVMGFNIFPYLIVGAFLYFYCIPKEYNDFLIKNQIFSSLFLLITFLFFYINEVTLMMLVVALVVTGYMELVYCFIFSRGKK